MALATLINPTTNEKRVVTVGSAEASQLMGSGFYLMGRGGVAVGWLDKFIRDWGGKIGANADGSYNGECVSLCHRWQDANGWPEIHANAIDWAKYRGSDYRFTPNYWWYIPRQGDFVVFDIGQYGHIGIVVSANLWSMQVFNQNWPHGNHTDPATITTFDYRRPRCVGFLRKT